MRSFLLILIKTARIKSLMMQDQNFRSSEKSQITSNYKSGIKFVKLKGNLFV